MVSCATGSLGTRWDLELEVILGVGLVLDGQTL